MNTYTQPQRGKSACTRLPLSTQISRIFTCIVMFFSLQNSLYAQATPAIQALDADTLLFHDEYEFRDFLQYYDLKHYTIKPQVDFYDCTVNPGTQIYTDQHDDDFLHEERFLDKPLIFIVDHNGTRKIYNILIPTLNDTTITTCSVDLLTMNTLTGQVAWFKDIYNWIDENGRNIFNMNKKLYFLWGFTSDDFDFPTDMIQTTTGIDFTFPNYFPEDSASITLIFKYVEKYNQVLHYPDADADGQGDNLTEGVLAYSFDPPTGYVINNTDCDDVNNLVHSGATEVDNSIDDDCNGLVDDYFQDFFADADGDGYGNAGVIIQDYVAPPGYVSDVTDCDDTNAEKNPGATEVCNNIDDDCDGTTDDTPVAMTATLNPVGSATTCRPQKVSLQAYPSGDGYTYVWKKNNIVISVADNTNPIAQFSNSGSYSVEVNLNEACNATSNSVAVSVYSKPASSVVNMSGTNNLCLADTIHLQAGNTAATNTYQWKRNNVNIAGATQSTFKATLVGDYKINTVNANGCSKVSAAYSITYACKESEDVIDNEILVYPNPVRDKCFIDLGKEYTFASVQLTDLTGRNIFNNNFSSAQLLEIEMPAAAGMYMIMIHTEAGDETRLISKE